MCDAGRRNLVAIENERVQIGDVRDGSQPFIRRLDRPVQLGNRFALGHCFQRRSLNAAPLSRRIESVGNEASSS